MKRTESAERGKNMKMPVFERYIAELIEKSTIEVPVWNIEKARGNGKGAGWNYVERLYDSGNAWKFIR